MSCVEARSTFSGVKILDNLVLLSLRLQAVCYTRLLFFVEKRNAYHQHVLWDSRINVCF